MCLESSRRLASRSKIRRPGAGRRDQAPQDRGDHFRVDREVEAVELVAGRIHAFAGLQLEQLFRVDGDRIGVDRRGRGDRGGDDLALRHQTLDPRLDQPLAELVEVEDARDQHAQSGQIEDEDAAREAGKDVVAKEPAQ